MTTPQTDVMDAGGVVVTVVTNAGTQAARYEIGFNTSAYLASVNTVSNTTGLFVSAGSQITTTLAPSASIYAYSVGPAEITTLAL